MGSFGKVCSVLAVLAFGLAGCGEEETVTETKEVIRGLKAARISAAADRPVRRYPSIIRPVTETALSFEVSGKLKAVSLEVGQEIAEGDVIAEIDPRSLQLQVEQAEAAVSETNAALANASVDYDRQATLLERGIVAQAAVDRSLATLKSAKAQAEQAEKKLALAHEDLDKAVLKSPFTGVISSVSVVSFGQISPGQEIVKFYAQGAYEAAFNVPAAVAGQIAVGDRAEVFVSAATPAPLPARISEIGSSASQVASFPVVVKLDDAENVKAGMAAEVALSLRADGDEGLLVPLSALAIRSGDGAEEVGAAKIYVYDEQTRTVAVRDVVIAGVRENRAVITSGLEGGEIVAIAGVSFLRDGQEVSLLPLTPIGD